jgi:acyl-CoA dehydrogenase
VDYVLNGTASRVPWARNCETLVVVATGCLACVPVAAATLTAGENVAGEPRDELRFDAVAVRRQDVRSAPVDREAIRARGALARAVALAGALESVLALTVKYANERTQFGRRIGQF